MIGFAKSLIRIASVSAPLIVSPAAAWAAHPMDPLTEDEIRIAADVIRQDERLADATLPFINDSRTATRSRQLPLWVQQDRSLRRRDIVIWVNLGMHHLPRSEGQPVMPTLWKSFKLRPFNFFDRNPVLDLRRETPSE